MMALGHGAAGGADPMPLIVLVSGIGIGAAALGALLWRRRRSMGE